MKSTIGIILSALLLVSRLGFAQGGHDTEQITIGTDAWPGFIALYVAQDQGYFKELGLNVEVKHYPSLAAVSEAYEKTPMQGRGNIALDAAKEKLSGVDHKIILAVNYSNGGDAVVAKKQVKSLSALSGKKVILQKGSLQDFFLSKVLADKKIAVNKQYRNPLDPMKQMASLRSGESDFAVLYEPFLSEMLSDSAFHSLYNSSQTPGLIVDVVTFKTDFVKAHPEAIRYFIQAYYKGLQFTREHPEEAYAILAKHLKVEPALLAKQFSGIMLLDQKDNVEAFAKNGGYWSLYNNLRMIDKYLRTEQAAPAEIDSTMLIDADFVIK